MVYTFKFLFRSVGYDRFNICEQGNYSSVQNWISATLELHAASWVRFNFALYPKSLSQFWLQDVRSWSIFFCPAPFISFQQVERPLIDCWLCFLVKTTWACQKWQWGFDLLRLEHDFQVTPPLGSHKSTARHKWTISDSGKKGAIRNFFTTKWLF